MSINEDIIEISPIKININDIFDKKVELGPLLQFNLLQKVIEEFINRQNKTDIKIHKLEIKLNKIYNLKGKNEEINSELEEENEINDIDFDRSEIEAKENNNELEGKYTDNKTLDYNINESKEGKNVTNIVDGQLNNNNIINNDNDLNEENKNRDKKENFERKNKLINQKEKLLSQLQSKLNKLENKFNELLDNFSLLNKQNKKDFQSIKSKNNGYDAKFTKQEKIIKEIADKLADLNIYEIFKGDNKDIDVDKATILIKGIEQNLSKKIEFSDMRNKANEEGILKIKNEIIDMKNSFESQISKNFKDNYSKFITEIESKYNLFKNQYDEILGLKEIVDNYVTKAELKKFYNEQNQKNNEFLKNSGKNGGSINNDEMIEKMNEISENLKMYVNKNLEDTENFIKNYVTNLNFDSINKEILKIKQDLSQKLNKDNLFSINLKIEQIENIQDNFKLQMEENKNDICCCNDKCSKAVRMIEILRAQMLNLNKEEKNDNNNNEENSKINFDIDLSIYIKKLIFDEEINKVYKKIEKIANLETDNYRNIQSIEERLKYFASENDLTNIEQYLINLIDEYKIKNSKKFVDKSEYQKSIKYLEVQIKHLNEITSKENENWLLAKKPINNYMCASCEAYIGDLKNKEEYSPWNKIPIREDYNKKYRLGHGFSKMLKMVNMDLLKKIQRVNSGVNIGIKNENKKINMKNLPKINIQNQNDNSGIQSLNFNNINSEEDLNDKINNSADNIENGNEINEPIKSERMQNTERMVNKSTNVNTGNNSFRNLRNSDTGQPKLIKIYKKNKK